MHFLPRAELSASGGRFMLRLDPDQGSAPDAELELSLCARPESGPWSAAFGSWEEMLAFVVPQDRAMSTQQWEGQVTRQEIQLGIPLAACEPIAGQVKSRAAETIVGDAQPFCFRVPAVSFRFESEQRDPLDPALDVAPGQP